MKNIRPIFILFFLLVSSISNAQLFELDFGKLSTLSKSPNTLEKGLSYYHKGIYDSANIFFTKAIEEEIFNRKVYLYHANTVKALRNSQLASEYYKLYINSLTSYQQEREKNFLSQLELSGDTSYEYTVVGMLKGGTNVAYYDKKLFIAQAGQIHSFLVSDKNTLEYYDREFLEFKNKTISGVAFLNKGNLVVLSVLNSQKKSSRLYYAEWKNNSWTKLKLIPTLDKKINAAFPANNVDGNELYFSYESEDGYGGYDINVCFFENGNWTAPVNLGENINTQGNEIFPRVENGILHFSSNGYPTFGGYDIFKIRLKEIHLSPVNAFTINSRFDDFSFISLPKSNYIYLYQKNGKTIVELLNKKFKNPIEEKDASPIVAVKKDGGESQVAVEKKHLKSIYTFSLSITNFDSKMNENLFVIIEPQNDRGVFYRTNQKGKLELNDSFHSDKLRIKIVAQGYEPKEMIWHANQHLNISLKPSIIEVSQSNIKSEVVQLSVVEKSANESDLEKKSKVENNTTKQLERPKEVIESNKEKSQKNAEKSQAKKETSPYSKPQKGMYYIIVASTVNRENALEHYNNHKNNFPDIKILEYGPKLYRIGFEAGKSEEEGMEKMRQARTIIYDAWLLRP